MSLIMEFKNVIGKRVVNKPTKKKKIQESAKITKNVKRAILPVLNDIKNEIVVPLVSIGVGKISEYKVEDKVYKSLVELYDDGLTLDLEGIVETAMNRDPYFLNKNGFYISGGFSVIDKKGISYRVFIKGNVDNFEEKYIFNLDNLEDEIYKAISSTFKAKIEVSAYDLKNSVIVMAGDDGKNAFLGSAIITLDEGVI